MSDTASAAAVPDLHPNRPSDDKFTQQRLQVIPAREYWNSITGGIIVILLGIICLPVGISLLKEARNVYEKKITYDNGYGSLCSIATANSARVCNVTFTFDKTVDSPVYFYYELENFYANHRRYLSSRSIYQLQGQNLNEDDVRLLCTPLYMNGSVLLNPCGLIANSFFNDQFSVADSSTTQYYLDETDISLPSDRDNLFSQVDGFQSFELTAEQYVIAGCSASQQYAAPNSSSTVCSVYNLNNECLCYLDSSSSTGNTYYLFYYPDDDTVQYLYETYPNQISPIDGVTDEHFIVWMRTSALTTFRKLYGRINTVDGSSFKAGDSVTMEITANFEVDSFSGTKTLLISDLGSLGGKNIFTGQAYITVGTLALVGGFAMLVGHSKLLANII